MSRLSDRQQIECFVEILVRICRQLTGRSLSPTKLPARIKKVLGCSVAFGSNVDEVVYPLLAMGLRSVNADPYLNSFLESYCEDALSNRRVLRHMEIKS